MKIKDLLPGTNPWFWIVFLAGLVAMVIPYIGIDLRFLPGDMGDTRLNIFFLEHARQFFSREISAYWNAGFMYPEAEVISYSENQLGTAPIFAMFRWMGADIFTAFQFWLVVVAFLNYWASFKLAEYLLQDRRAAAIAAFIFAFSVSITSQMNHAQTFPRFALPLSLFFLLRWLKELRPRYFVLSVTFLVYQFYCGIYLGFMSAIPYVILFGIGTWTNRHEIIRRIRSTPDSTVYAGAILLHGWLMVRLFLPYLRRAGHLGMQPFADVIHSIPTPLSYLAAHPASIIYSPMHRLVTDYQAFWDHWIFPGMLAIAGFATVFVLLAIAYLSPQSKISKLASVEQKWFFLTGFIIFIFYLRIDQWSLYYLIHHLPGFGAMRSMTRVINTELLFIGMTLAFTVTVMIKRFTASPAMKTWLLTIFMAVLLVDNLTHPRKIVRMQKAEVMARHEQLIGKIAHLAPGSVISYEPDSMMTNPVFYQIDAMLAAQALHLRSVNGYTATSHHMYTPYWFEPNTENRLYWFSRFPEMPEEEVYVIN